MPTAVTAVNDGPFAALSHPNANGLHGAAAVRLPVARLVVYMQAGKAIRAMVAVVTPCAVCHIQAATYPAGKAVVASVVAVISFGVFDSFVFPVQKGFPPKSVCHTFREALRSYAMQTSRFVAMVFLFFVIKHVLRFFGITHSIA